MLVLSMVAQFDWRVLQFDVASAYLNADPVRTVYATYPAGFRDFLQRTHDTAPFNPDEYLLRVAKNVYGAPDAGRIWYERLSEVLTGNLGFHISPVDRCLFKLTSTSNNTHATCILLVYVDDLLIAGEQSLVERVSAALRQQFVLKEGGQDYLGLEINTQTNGTVRVSQGTYARSIVTSTGYNNSNSVPTPLPTDFTAATTDVPRGAAQGAAVHLDFPKVNGAIGYLTKTMPTLLYSFGVFASVARPSAAAPEAPTPAHRAAMARCLRFICSYGHVGLVFTRAATFTLSAYCDASHGSEIHQTAAGYCKGRSGGVILACGATIAAFSSIQQATALSTFESELYALVAVVRLLLASRQLASFILGHTLSVSTVKCDNASVIQQLQRRDLRQRTRHIRVHVGFLIDAVENGEINVIHVPTATNAANTLTAAEDRDRFARSFAILHGTTMTDF